MRAGQGLHVSPYRVVDTRQADPLTFTFSGGKVTAGETVHLFVVGSPIDGQSGALCPEGNVDSG